MANYNSEKAASDQSHESYSDDAKARRVLIVSSSGTLSETLLISHPLVQGNVQTDWTITRSDTQPDTETVSFSDGSSYTMTFTYGTVGAENNRLITRSRWIKN